jgi:hypothetical protein
MAHDNFTLRKVRALKITPDGHAPGDVFDVTQDVANVLTSDEVGDVEYVDQAEPVLAGRGRYARRDLRAKE